MLFVLIALVVIIVALAWNPFARKSCTWQPDPRQLADGRDLWTCATCGASDACARGRKPVTCLAKGPK